VELFELPEGWRWKRLPELVDLKNGGTPSKANPEYWKNGNIPFVTAADCTEVYVFQGRSYLTEEGLLSGKTVVCEPGDVLIGTRTRVGNCSIAKVRLGASQDLTRARLNSICIPEYLCLYIRNMASDVAFFSQGTSIQGITRNFLHNLSIPVPPVKEQRRIVGRIDELTRRAEEIRHFRRDARNEAALFMHERIDKLLTGLTDKFLPLKQCIIGKPRNGWSPLGDSSASNGIPVLTLSAVTGFKYDGSKIKWTASPTRSGAHYWLKAGELLITRSNTRELVGHAAIYDGTPAPCICSDLIMKMTVDPEKADTRFIHYWLQTWAARNYLMTRARGTSGSMKKINQGHVENIPVPSIPVEDQRRIVGNLCAFQAKADELKRLQAETEADLTAFTPALLAKAFRGEL
jgi:type I restriction enzyme S subunit